MINDDDRIGTPGPGHYDEPRARPRSAMSFSRLERQTVSENQSYSMPGQYSIRETLVTNRIRTIRFSKMSNRMSQNQAEETSLHSYSRRKLSGIRNIQGILKCIG